MNFFFGIAKPFINRCLQTIFGEHKVNIDLYFSLHFSDTKYHRVSMMHFCQNGPQYAQNKYDEKLQEAYMKYK